MDRLNDLETLLEGLSAGIRKQNWDGASRICNRIHACIVQAAIAGAGADLAAMRQRLFAFRSVAKRHLDHQGARQAELSTLLHYTATLAETAMTCIPLRLAA